MRMRVLGLATVMAVAVLSFVAPVAQAADCETLQNSYAAVVSKALVRAHALGLSDEDFVHLRDDLQAAALDNDLSTSEQVSLAARYPVLIKVQDNPADKALIADLLSKYYAYVQAGCDKSNGDADAGTVPSDDAPKSATKAPTSTEKAPASSSFGSGGQVSTVPNDAPETGDGSTVGVVQGSSLAVGMSVFVLLTVAISGLAAARRSRS